MAPSVKWLMLPIGMPGVKVMTIAQEVWGEGAELCGALEAGRGWAEYCVRVREEEAVSSVHGVEVAEAPSVDDVEVAEVPCASASVPGVSEVGDNGKRRRESGRGCQCS